jgi:Tfp pilus assembly protein FimT
LVELLVVIAIIGVLIALSSCRRLSSHKSSRCWISKR